MKKSEENQASSKKITRRDMLKMTGIGAAGLVMGVSGTGGILHALGSTFEDDNPSSINKVNFYGSHQSGIATETQSHLYFVSLNSLTKSQSELQDLFKLWTALSVRLMNGDLVADLSSNGFVPPKDTGEAKGLDASNLTLTFGVGPSLFEKTELGISQKKPKELADLPHFPKDQLDQAFTGGDLCIQACADDPQVAFHAVRNLIRAASGKVTLKWSQAGFNSYPVKDNKKQTPRNLFGFKDGTGNLNTKDPKELDAVVWIQPGESASWLSGGTYLVARRIQMHLETWDRTALNAQEATFGRHRDSGAPFEKQNEFDEFGHTADGKENIPEDSHVHLARATKARIFRRSFSYSSGIIDSTGTYDAGLMFISFQNDPKQFIDIQNSFGRADKLNEYITHRGSALFACFPGIEKGRYIGEAFFSTL